jgi:uncharacterized membrane protein YkoI
MRRLAMGLFVVLTVGATAAWKVRHDYQEHQDVLLARAAITMDAARETAFSSVPADGRVTEEEIEEENGRLVYSFDIEVPGQGRFDVEVDAMTGQLLQSGLDDEEDGDDDDGEDDDGPRV